MEPPPQARVLRCCCCRAFQAHQVKKSLKWTCKVCGEQQSFLRAYGEGSGADCRRHVQKLNLLQAQLSEMPCRSPEEPASARRERQAGPGLAEHASAQEEPQPSWNHWQKYLERGSGELGLPGVVGFSRWTSSTTEKPDAASGTSLPRKRRWSQSAVQPPHSPAGQDEGDSEVTLETQKVRDKAGEGSVRAELSQSCRPAPSAYCRAGSHQPGQGQRDQLRGLERWGALSLGGRHGVPPSRSGPHLLSGYDSFHHLGTAHTRTQSPQHPYRGTPCQLGQHRLSRGPPGLEPPGTGASAGLLVHSSFLGPHTLPHVGPRGSSGQPLSSCGVQALKQRAGPWSEGHRSPDLCGYMTSLTPVRTSMTFCEPRLACHYVGMSAT